MIKARVASLLLPVIGGCGAVASGSVVVGIAAAGTIIVSVR